jgi:hypothetical protein
MLRKWKTPGQLSKHTKPWPSAWSTRYSTSKVLGARLARCVHATNLTILIVVCASDLTPVVLDCISAAPRLRPKTQCNNDHTASMSSGKIPIPALRQSSRLLKRAELREGQGWSRLDPLSLGQGRSPPSKHVPWQESSKLQHAEIPPYGRSVFSMFVAPDVSVQNTARLFRVGRSLRLPRQDRARS